MIDAVHLVRVVAQSDVVQVELINESPWWADPLPWIAIVISVFTLAWTIYDRKRGAARIVARNFSLAFAGQLQGVTMPLVSCRIENKGLVQATEISSIRCMVPDYRLRDLGASVEIRMELTKDLPFRIEPGASVGLDLNARHILWALQPGVKIGQRWRRSQQLRRAAIEVTTGHGVTKLRFSRWTRSVLSARGQWFDNTDIPGVVRGGTREESRARHPSQQNKGHDQAVEGADCQR